MLCQWALAFSRSENSYNKIVNPGTTAPALSMIFLDMLILVKGNYDVKVKSVPSSPFTFTKMNKWTKIII